MHDDDLAIALDARWPMFIRIAAYDRFEARKWMDAIGQGPIRFVDLNHREQRLIRDLLQRCPS